MSKQFSMVSESMAFATFLIVIDIITTLIISLAAQIPYSFFSVATLMIPEFAVMFIIGGCLMARQPLEDEARYDKDGNPVRSWRYAILGKKVILSAFFLFIFAGVFTLLAILMPS
jgi:hypothetical protein